MFDVNKTDWDLSAQAIARWGLAVESGALSSVAWSSKSKVDLASSVRWGRFLAINFVGSRLDAAVGYAVRWALGLPLLDGSTPYVLPPVSVYPVDLVKFPVIIPALGAYFVTNNISVARLSDGKLLEPLAISINANASSWGWSGDIALDPVHFDDVLPAVNDGVDLEIIINNQRFILTVRSVARRSVFGKDAVSVKAVSRAVWLGEPFAPVTQRLNTSAMTAHQLADAAMLAAPYAGATGFSISWGLTDWLVPEGAFSFTGTPLAYIGEIAKAVGGTVLAGRDDLVLKMLPLFPVKSWAFNSQTPDYILPTDIITTDSLDFDDYPVVNAVTLVGGAVGGIIDNVTRQGTAGNKYLQPVTHPLFTNVIATQQRGIYELSQTGRVYKSTVDLPLLESVGVVEPGKFVQIAGSSDVWISRGVTVSARVPTVMQSVQLERWVS